MAPMGDYAIEATDLVREFKNGPRAVDAIDLGVAPGEIYGFLGPNGAGKSTTVHMLTTLLPPTSGTARVAGYDVVSEGSHVRATIGAALQEAALDPLLTGREHLRLQASLQAQTRPELNDGDAHGDPPYLLEDGWTPLLNGKDLAGWHGDSATPNDWFTTKAIFWDRLLAPLASRASVARATAC